MRRVAPSFWQQMPSVPRGWRTLGLFSSLGLACACSVYTSGLVDQTTGGAGSSSGKAGDMGGTGATTGGKDGGGAPDMGGDGGTEPDTTEAGKGGGGGGGGTTAGGGGSANGGAAGGTAGASGSAGATGSTDGLIDGFEDDDLILEQTDGRGGVWYWVGDGTTGALGPTPFACSPNSGAPEELGAFAMHITATGFTGTGTVLGADFRDLKKVYDASAFTGVRLWAKVAAGKNTKYRVQIADSTTDKAGMKCVPGSTVAAEKCDDHFGVNATFTTTWAQYSYTFKQMTQLGWGKSAPAIDKAAVYGLQVTAKANAQVDVWLDQIEFF